MANISKINAIALANIAKLDAVDAANIAKVNGLTFTDAGVNPNPATSGFLFTYSGAGGAYSVRQLNNNAATALRVRRASDNAEIDIGFDGSGDLLTVDIANHCGTSDGFCSIWYDQTGDQNHSEQTDTDYQPKIYDGTTQSVLEEGSTGNEKPTLEFKLVSSNVPYMLHTSLDAQGIFAVSRPETAVVGSANFLNGLSTNTGFRGLCPTGDSGGRTARAFTNTGSLNITALGSLTNQCFLAFNSNGSTGSLEYNGANEVTGGASQMTVDKIGSNRASGSDTQYRLEGNCQELILYDSDQTSNRTGIETNVNGYFNIF